MNKKECKVDSCIKPSKVKGYCVGHYAQIERYGIITSEVLRQKGRLSSKDEQKIIQMLQETVLTYKEIGTLFGVSLGPIYSIKKKYKIERPDISTFKQIECKWCNKVFIPNNKSRQKKFCCFKCYINWKRLQYSKTNGSLSKLDKDKVVTILRETELLPSEIGTIFNVSGRLISRIQKEHNIDRQVSWGLDGGFFKCKTCKQIFRRSKIKDLIPKGFCSLKCYKNRLHLESFKINKQHGSKSTLIKNEINNNLIRYSYQCNFCKSSFHSRDIDDNAMKFCSHGCYINWQKSGDPEGQSYFPFSYREKIIVSMLEETKLSHEEIGSVFNISRGPVSLIQKKYNIKRISSKGDDLFRRCKTCRKVFRSCKMKSRPNSGKYCSKQCYTIWQKSDENKGPNNPRYIDGGNESLLNKLRKTDRWKEWRESVYKRDDYTCFLCEQKGERLHPHHIKKKSLYPDLVFEVSNGITLCQDCHHLEGVHVDGGDLEKRFQKVVCNLK